MGNFRYFDSQHCGDGLVYSRGGDSIQQEAGLATGRFSCPNCRFGLPRTNPSTGLKGKYDKKKGEDARRRAHLKRCIRCKVNLEISEDVDFRYAIGEFESEDDFIVTGDAAGVSCANCHADFCHECMVTFGKRHLSSGGLACLDCGGNMTQFRP